MSKVVFSEAGTIGPRNYARRLISERERTLSLLQEVAWKEVAWIATPIGALIAVCTIGFTVFQYYRNTKINRARFWLDLRTMFASHDKVHVDLKPGSKWGAIRTVSEEHDAYIYREAPTEEGPSTPQEWAPVEAYMGLFELCEMMLKEKLIDKSYFEDLYKYRLTNMMWNRVIVNQKIIRKASGWQGFKDLLDRFEIEKAVREPKEEKIKGPIDVAMSQQANEQEDNNHMADLRWLAGWIAGSIAILAAIIVIAEHHRLEKQKGVGE
jgi:hypothetical protein